MTRAAGTRRVKAPMLPFSKAPLGPEGDLHCLFAEGGHGGAVLAVQGDVDDAEPDLWLGRPSSVPCRTVHGPIVTIWYKRYKGQI